MWAILRRLLKVNSKIVISFCFFTVLFYYCGVFTYFLEKNFPSNFSMEPNFLKQIEELRKGKPSVPPVNFYNYDFIYNGSQKCYTETRLKLVYIVKSALKNSERRNAIRRTWGFEKRFSDVEIRTVFVLGVDSDEKTQSEINEENTKYGDIIQAKFHDNYYNNTIKTMIAIKWGVTYCGDAKFYFFSDDDMYISTKNVLRFLRNPLDYPHYLEMPVVSLKRLNVKLKRDFNFTNTKSDHVKRRLNYAKSRKLKQVLDYELDDKAELYTGYVFPSSHPQRHRWSKWYVPLGEYPYNRWPPYITAGSYVLSNVVLHNFYLTSQYTPHFRFDDIYLGILAWKLGIAPVHSNEFYFYKKSYDVDEYKYVVASHGYDNPKELEAIWNEQKRMGNA